MLAISFKSSNLCYDIEISGIFIVVMVIIRESRALKIKDNDKHVGILPGSGIF
jgi:hypothetical protein